MPGIEDLLPSILGGDMGGGPRGPRAPMSSPGLAENELFALALLQNQPQFDARQDPGPVGQILNAVAPFLIAQAQTRQAVAQQGQLEKAMAFKALMEQMALEKAGADLKLVEAKTKKAEADAVPAAPIGPEVIAQMDAMAKERGLRSSGVKLDMKTRSVYPEFTTPLAPTGGGAGGTGAGGAKAAALKGDLFATPAGRFKKTNFDQTGQYEAPGGVQKSTYPNAAAIKASELLTEAQRLTPLVDQLRTVVNRTPESIGLSGDWTRMIQGAWQQADQFGLKGVIEQGRQQMLADKRNGLLADDFEDRYFNPDYDTAEALTGMLSYLHARVIGGAGVLSNQDVDRSQTMLTGATGWTDLNFGGAKSLLANLGVMEQLVSSRAASAKAILDARDAAVVEMRERELELLGLPPRPIPSAAGAAAATTPPLATTPTNPLTQYQEKIDKVIGQILPDMSPDQATVKAFALATQIAPHLSKAERMSMAVDMVRSSGWTGGR